MRKQAAGRLTRGGRSGENLGACRAGVERESHGELSGGGVVLLRGLSGVDKGGCRDCGQLGPGVISAEIAAGIGLRKKSGSRPGGCAIRFGRWRLWKERAGRGWLVGLAELEVHEQRV